MENQPNNTYNKIDVAGPRPDEMIKLEKKLEARARNTDDYVSEVTERYNEIRENLKIHNPVFLETMDAIMPTLIMAADRMDALQVKFADYEDQIIDIERDIESIKNHIKIVESNLEKEAKNQLVIQLNRLKRSETGLENRLNDLLDKADTIAESIIELSGTIDFNPLQRVEMGPDGEPIVTDFEITPSPTPNPKEKMNYKGVFGAN